MCGHGGLPLQRDGLGPEAHQMFASSRLEPLLRTATPVTLGDPGGLF
jgi:hypothetical protein